MKFALLLVAVLVHLANAYDVEEAKKNLHDFRVTNQNLHIDSLEEQVAELEEEFEKLSDLPEKQQIREIKARIRNLEGSGCDKDHVQCGGKVPECISPLFVCDGYEDCKNGRDEDEDVCSDEPYKVGTTISGITSWHDCFTHTPHMTVVTITANDKPEGYTSRVYVRAVVSFEVDEHSHLVQSFSARGYWNSGRRALVLVPTDNKNAYGHGIVCKFNLGSNDIADCVIGTVASRHECGTFRAERV
jgi:hypothetical protein